MIVGANLPEGHPARVAAIAQHVEDALSPHPVRQARGQANLRKLNLSPSERLTITHPAPTPPQLAQAQPAGLVTSQPVRMDTSGIDRAVNHFVAQQLKGLNLGSFRVGGGKLPNHVESALGLHIVSLARSYLGTPYLWGGRTPKGFDCSGFAQFLYGKVGVSIPPTTFTQWKAGYAVAKRALQPGDLVFFKGGDSIDGLPGHVGVYIGHGMMIDEPHTGSHARVESVFNFGGYMGARRYGK